MRTSWISRYGYLFSSILLGCLAMALPGAAQANTQKQQIAGLSAGPLTRIKAIDESQLVTLGGNVHPLAQARNDQGAAPDSLALGRMTLVLKGTAAQQADLDKLVNDQQNPHSANYHKWITPELYGARFGVSSADIAQITLWLERYGFTVEPPVAGRNLIRFSGTNAQLRSAFHTEMHLYNVNGQSYYANAADPQVPAALAPVVAGFASLNNFPRKAYHTAPRFVRRDGGAWKQAQSDDIAKQLSQAPPKNLASKPHAEFTTIDSNGDLVFAVGPSDLATIYNFQPLWDAGIDGTDETIAIVSDSDINPADVDYFRSTFGLSPKKLNILYDGQNPGKTKNEDEADLDVEWAGAVAKNATIDLVVAPDTFTTFGVVDAAVYAVDNNLAPILSVSYGGCELALGTSGNQFFSQLWEQAAAQGITVAVATGDSGSAGCDPASAPPASAQFGLQVSGYASTPYNIAVGGTDFFGNYISAAQYWNPDNNSTTLASAKSYIPEIPWNDSCANPFVLSVLQSNGITDSDTTALCNDANAQSIWLDVVGGGGGVSACTQSTGGYYFTCQGGYPKPAWQSGVPGIPSDGLRDVPDVSLMAGDGIWGSFYVFCQSDKTPSGQCDVSQYLEGAGGTSFATPIFAGMLALVEQKTANHIGNANYVLYKLANAQYAGPGAYACNSFGIQSGNACIFYDVVEGSNAEPCAGYSANCDSNIGINSLGVLPGYSATMGYDTATGLGTINAENLVNSWESAAGAFLKSAVALTPQGGTSATYGNSLGFNVSVAPAGSETGVPSGDIGVTSNAQAPNGDGLGSATLANGQASVSYFLRGGNYHLFAHYEGDATFAPSTSGGVSVSITPATIAGATATASREQIAAGEKVTFSVSVPGVTNGVGPTGTATFTDVTTGAVLGAVPLTEDSTANGSVALATAYITIASGQLAGGSNTISVAYSGDANYAPFTITGSPVSVTSSFTAAVTPGAVSLSPGGSGTVTVTVTPASGTVLSAGSLAFACPANLGAGLTCTFSTPALNTNGTVSTTLTLGTGAASSSSSRTVATAKVRPARAGWLSAGAAASLSGLLLLCLPARRRVLMALALFAFVPISFLMGCGSSGGSSGKSTVPTATSTTLTASAVTPSYNSPVTFTASVIPASGSGAPTGTVTFTSGSVTLGTASVSSGVATFTTSTLPAGPQSVTASYGGDNSYASSTSAADSLDVIYTTNIAVTATDKIGDSSVANLTVTVQ